MNKTVNLVDIDKTNFPNLALMKLSAFYKSKGYKTYLNGVPGDLNFISCVFTKNKNKLKLYKEALNATTGGSGIDYSIVLDKEIEFLCPDYSLYHKYDIKFHDYSLGFTSRGCFRNCGFCLVRKKEGVLKEWSDLQDFVKHRKVIILDNNFLASPKCEEKLQWMINKKLAVDFNQGLDIRLIDDVNSKLLIKLNPLYYRFSWDNMSIESFIIKGLKLLKKKRIT